MSSEQNKTTITILTVLLSAALCICTFVLIGRTGESFLYSLVIIAVGLAAGVLFRLNNSKISGICIIVISLVLSVATGINGMKVWYKMDESGGYMANSIYDSGMFDRDIYARVKNDNVFVTQTLNMYAGFMSIGNYIAAMSASVKFHI